MAELSTKNIILNMDRYYMQKCIVMDIFRMIINTNWSASPKFLAPQDGLEEYPIVKVFQVFMHAIECYDVQSPNSLSSRR